MDKENMINEWLKDELSESEKKEFESSKEFENINRMMNALKHFKASQFNKEEQYPILHSKTFGSSNNYNKIRYFSPRIAAAIAILLFIGYIAFNYFPTKETHNGNWLSQNSEIYLPDSSLVNLNKDSKIRYSNKSWNNNRMVELQGEAFFKVKKGSKFSVKTNTGIVTVLGTEFNVKDREKYYEVTCYSGKVHVDTPDKSIILTPHNSFRIINNKVEENDHNESTLPDWINGESNFISVPFRFVINELERQYKVTITTRNMDKDLLFTGGFTNKNLDLALKAITIPLNLHYETDKDNVVIAGEKK